MTESSDKKGFAGLSSLASDVDEAAPQTRGKPEEVKPGGATAKPSDTSGARPAPPPRTEPELKPQSEPEVGAAGWSQGAGKGSSGRRGAL